MKRWLMLLLVAGCGTPGEWKTEATVGEPLRFQNLTVTMRQFVRLPGRRVAVELVVTNPTRRAAEWPDSKPSVRAEDDAARVYRPPPLKVRTNLSDGPDVAEDRGGRVPAGGTYRRRIYLDRVPDEVVRLTVGLRFADCTLRWSGPIEGGGGPRAVTGVDHAGGEVQPGR